MLALKPQCCMDCLRNGFKTRLILTRFTWLESCQCLTLDTASFSQRNPKVWCKVSDELMLISGSDSALICVVFCGVPVCVHRKVRLMWTEWRSHQCNIIFSHNCHHSHVIIPNYRRSREIQHLGAYWLVIRKPLCCQANPRLTGSPSNNTNIDTSARLLTYCLNFPTHFVWISHHGVRGVAACTLLCCSLPAMQQILKKKCLGEFPKNYKDMES